MTMQVGYVVHTAAQRRLEYFLTNKMVVTCGHGKRHPPDLFDKATVTAMQRRAGARALSARPHHRVVRTATGLPRVRADRGRAIRKAFIVATCQILPTANVGELRGARSELRTRSGLHARHAGCVNGKIAGAEGCDDAAKNGTAGDTCRRAVARRLVSMCVGWP